MQYNYKSCCSLFFLQKVACPAAHCRSPGCREVERRVQPALLLCCFLQCTNLVVKSRSLICARTEVNSRKWRFQRHIWYGNKWQIYEPLDGILLVCLHLQSSPCTSKTLPASASHCCIPEPHARISWSRASGQMQHMPHHRTAGAPIRH